MYFSIHNAFEANFQPVTWHFIKLGNFESISQVVTTKQELLKPNIIEYNTHSSGQAWSHLSFPYVI